MNIFSRLLKNIFYSDFHYSIIHQNRADSSFYNIKYKSSICGSLYIKDNKIALIYSTIFDCFKGLIEIENLDIKYSDETLELYTINSNKRILKAKCDPSLYEAIINKINS